jgi:hypothetical protein
MRHFTGVGAQTFLYLLGGNQLLPAELTDILAGLMDILLWSAPYFAQAASHAQLRSLGG